MKIIHNVLILSFCVTAFSSFQLHAAPVVVEKPVKNISLENEVRHAIDRGLSWLKENQTTNGYWGNGEQPALTAMVLVAFQGADGKKDTEFEKRAYDYLVGCAKPDGSIHNGKGLLNYNTSVSVLALMGAKQKEFKPLVLNARKYLIGSQIDMGEPGKMDDVFDGGIGYGSHYQHSDLANTVEALEALHYSKSLAADQKDSDAKDLNWKAAIQFLQNCQNLPEYNKQKWVADDEKNKGGFVYYPGNSNAGETNLASGRVALRSYGSMSYAGLLSYVYADLKQNDPRVVAVMKWLQDNYTLDENPGMGPQGLYYYYHTMAKALNTSSVDKIKVDGKKIDWRKELALKLINLQQTNGSWMNENGRWWEKEPLLVTAYATISLEIIAHGL